MFLRVVAAAVAVVEVLAGVGGGGGLSVVLQYPLSLLLLQADVLPVQVLSVCLHVSVGFSARAKTKYNISHNLATHVSLHTPLSQLSKISNLSLTISGHVYPLGEPSNIYLKAVFPQTTSKTVPGVLY